MEDNSYLTKEQLRYIRRLSKSKLSQPQDILPMIDLVYSHYKRRVRGSLSGQPWNLYEHDIHYILHYWPYLEVHLHVAMLDPKFMKNLYAGLESSGPENHYEQTPHNIAVYKNYLSIRDIIPTVRNAMVIVG